MTEKVHKEKLQGLQTRLTYGESSHQNSQTREETQFSESDSCDRRKRPKKKRKPSLVTTPRSTRPSQGTGVFSRLRREGDKPTRRRSLGQRPHHGADTRVKGERPVRAGRRKTHIVERKKQEILFEATSHASVNVKEKSKKNGTPLTVQATGNLLGPKKLTSPKMKTIRADNKSHGRRNVDQMSDGQCPPGVTCSTPRSSAQQGYSSTNSHRNPLITMKCYGKRSWETSHNKRKSMHDEAPECMRITRFMHGITNPNLIKKLNDNILKSVDEMISVTTSFLRGEVAAANQSRKKIQPAWRHNEMKYRPNFDKRLDFKSQHKSSRQQDRQKTTQSFFAGREVSFPPRASSGGQENPIVIEAEVEGHLIYRMYVDGGSASEVLYEHCFNKLHPKGALRKFPDELHGGHISIIVQWHHWSSWSQKIPSSLVHGPRNAQIPRGGRNSDTPQQYRNTDRMQNDMTGVPRSIEEHHLNIHEHKAKKKGACTRQKQGNSRGSYQACGSWNHEGGSLSRLALKPSHGKEARWDIEETFQKLRRINMKLNPKVHLRSERRNVLGSRGYHERNQGIPRESESCDKATISQDAERGSKPQRKTGKLKQIPTQDQGPGSSSQVEKGNNSALRFEFDASNNEAAYEDLVAGLRIAEQMGVKNLIAKVESRLVANQINGSYGAKEQSMIQYLEKSRALISNLKTFLIEQVPRSKNKKADAQSKMASTRFAHLTKQVLVEILKNKSTEKREVLAIVEEEGYCWMTPLIEYLAEGTLPT
nr:reverse transcriptase domain-containing protein [Tanacetum cinerariifolium]